MDAGTSSSSSLPMALAEYSRYGRQMILPSIGLPGQLRLRSARVLVVGAGGLGCPSIQYLAAAGVGFISIVDHDVVEKSNLARQILHTDARVGMSKAKSASIAAQTINPHVVVNPVEEAFSVRNAVRLVESHDIVLDCTDNVLTRYLISDAAVLCGRQVVSGAAQGFDGQLVTLHKDLRPRASCAGVSSGAKEKDEGTHAARGPCYRCLFPKAPRPETVTDCEDGGVLGTITGLVGTMQAFETINMLLGLSAENADEEDIALPSFMTLVSPLSFPPFRSVKLRPRRSAICRACSDRDESNPDSVVGRVTAESMTEEEYMTFCGLSNPRHLSGFVDITVSELEREMANGERQQIIDVRPEVEFQIAHLPNTKNVTMRALDADPLGLYREIRHHAREGSDGRERVFVLCRRGNDSRIACHALAAAADAADAESSHGRHRKLEFVNVQGGLRAWASEVDTQFPVY